MSSNSSHQSQRLKEEKNFDSFDNVLSICSTSGYNCLFGAQEDNVNTNFNI